MILRSLTTTKLKNIGWADKKVKFFNGLEEAGKIEDAGERAKYYTQLRSQCKMTDLKRRKNKNGQGGIYHHKNGKWYGRCY